MPFCSCGEGFPLYRVRGFGLWEAHASQRPRRRAKNGLFISWMMERCTDLKPTALAKQLWQNSFPAFCCKNLCTASASSRTRSFHQLTSADSRVT